MRQVMPWSQSRGTADGLTMACITSDLASAPIVSNRRDTLRLALASRRILEGTTNALKEASACSSLPDAPSVDEVKEPSVLGLLVPTLDKATDSMVGHLVPTPDKTKEVLQVAHHAPTLQAKSKRYSSSSTVMAMA
mmetsp:Transcript_92838/g.170666  ORF Transcript_92838/g.170666 Transcript_92838/m.170666 type:complete len:136 (+) Transcript_92838:411-818(+)